MGENATARPWRIPAHRASRRFWEGDVFDQQHSVVSSKTHLGLKIQHGVVPDGHVLVDDGRGVGEYMDGGVVLDAAAGADADAVWDIIKKTLDLSRTPVTDDELRHLLPLTGLTVLYLSRTGITDAGMTRASASEGSTPLLPTQLMVMATKLNQVWMAVDKGRPRRS